MTLDDETDKLDAYVEDMEKAQEVDIKKLESEIKAAKKTLRGATELSMQEKLTEKRRIKKMEVSRDDKRLAIFEQLKEICKEVDDMLDDIADSLDNEIKLEHLFTIRWEVEK